VQKDLSLPVANTRKEGLQSPIIPNICQTGLCFQEGHRAYLLGLVPCLMIKTCSQPQFQAPVTSNVGIPEKFPDSSNPGNFWQNTKPVSQIVVHGLSATSDVLGVCGTGLESRVHYC
jgi:hypothetical protein